MAEEKTITVKKSDLWKYATFVLIAVVIIGGFIMFKGDGSTGTGNDTGANNPTSINTNALIDTNDPILGDKNAEITVIEFSDFQCPFCEKAYSGAMTELKNSDYFKNGEVNLIFKQLPLVSIHPYAQKAAEASLCADEQGKFWEMHDKLFENNNALTIANIKSYASQLNLDTTKFNKCLDDGKYASEVSKESAQAASVGGSGTPFFIIAKDGKGGVISGACPWAAFKTAIDATISGKSWSQTPGSCTVVAQ